MPIASSILPLACILPFCTEWWGDIGALTNLKMWGIICIFAILVNVFILLFIRRPYKKQKCVQYLLTLFEAGSMEIPMRMMMMNFLLLLLEHWCLPRYLSIVFTGIVWCMAILVQAVVFHQQWKETVIEMIASFMFSLGVGYVYYSTRVLLFAIVGHVLERAIGLEVVDVRQRYLNEC